MATRTISVAGGNTSATACWDEGIVPGASDDIVARGDGTSGAITIDATLACRSADFTNYSALVTQSAAFNIGTTTTTGTALKLVPAMTWTRTSGALSFVSTGGGTITFAGVNMGSTTVIFNGVASWTVTDGFTSTNSGSSMTFTFGTVDLTGTTNTCGLISSANANTRAVNATNATFNVITTTATVTAWNFTTTSGHMTFTGTGSTINLTGVVNSGARTFAGDGLTYGTLNYTVSGTSGLTITGANTFTSLTVTGASRTLTLPAATTTTVTTLTLRGRNTASLLTIASSTPTSAAVLSVASGTVYGRFLSISDNTGQGGATFVAIGSTLVSNTSGWTAYTFYGGSLNDQMLSSLQAKYASVASLQDLLTRFETDNSLKGQASWYGFYGGPPGDFNDLALTYWSTH